MPDPVEVVMMAVKPRTLESSPRLATTTPIRARMTFIAQPFRHLPLREPTSRILQVAADIASLKG
jgi:hypothetical protein